MTPLGVDEFATHRLPLADAAAAYGMFQRKADGAVKIMLKPWSWSCRDHSRNLFCFTNQRVTRDLSTIHPIGESRDEPYP
jgi:hypothetical protein